MSATNRSGLTERSRCGPSRAADPEPSTTSSAPPTGHSAHGPGKSAAPSSTNPELATSNSPNQASTGRAPPGGRRRSNPSATNAPAPSSQKRAQEWKYATCWSALQSRHAKTNEATVATATRTAITSRNRRRATHQTTSTTTGQTSRNCPCTASDQKCCNGLALGPAAP
jgi:hypothetical protein